MYIKIQYVYLLPILLESKGQPSLNFLLRQTYNNRAPAEGRATCYLIATTVVQYNVM